MDGIMHGAIHEVAQDKTGEEHKCILPHDKIRQPENSRSDNNAWYRRHEKPLLIAGIMMVITMQSVNKLLRTGAFTYPVEKKAMGKIFKQCPEKHASKKCQHHAEQRKAKSSIAVIQHKADHRKIHAPDHQWVGLGKHFQVIVLKQTGLAFIVDFLKLHRGKDTKKPILTSGALEVFIKVLYS